MNPSEEILRRAVGDTLRTISHWGSIGVDGDVNTAELQALAELVETQDVADWWACPICQETECDTGCPLKPLRDAAFGHAP